MAKKSAKNFEAGGGERTPIDRLLPAVYESLRSLAREKMRHEPAGHTLQSTALVHEAYLRLVENGGVNWSNPAHFYCAAAEAMRRILVERARRYRRLKHGAGLARVPLEEAEPASPSRAPDVLALDEALTRLESLDPRKADIVKLRYFIGFTIAETAETLGISPATVKLDWTHARAWLRHSISSEAGV